MKKFVCRICGSTFTSKKADKHREPKYCSKECYAESLKRYKVCQCCGELFANNANEKFCSANCRIANRRGVALSLEMRIKLSNARKASNKCKGENLYNWKGGKATEGERAKLAYHKRRSKLNHKLDDKFLKRLYKAQREQCFYCGEQLQSYKAIEHLTPVSRGGDNDSCNIVYACRSCNSQKKDMTLEEFAIKTHRIYLCDKYDLIMTMAL